MPKFTKKTKIINIGHLQGHTKGKVDILNLNGYSDVSAILCKEMPMNEIKSILKEASEKGAMFLVGGAMMNSFPEMMSEILDYIQNECPKILVVKTIKTDFDEGIAWPPTEQDVNKSALNICTRLLDEGKEW